MSVSRCRMSVLLTYVWTLKSNSSSVFLAGQRAAVIRSSPEASREGDLGLEKCVDETLVAPLLLAGAVAELRQRPGGGRVP
jgi:hypothetical protein